MKNSIWLRTNKLKIKKKLEKEYEFTKSQIEKIFWLWAWDYKWLSEIIKQFEQDNQWLWYSELWQEIKTFLYDVLMNYKK